ncbi:gamma-glutamyltranspeptidase [Fimicolochytrium jonesii]|uniref:gamma-glutamyltranspeptidase n=1 Tax=Fimicolochytrium jonesii TaxID=1396493 RepID=UPI0022FE159B|nr:gamma-glutamyltranspeptidase [Fimicolochytrium jonesii]KAI8825657.1 gamma-glutamyltranspeptidase [Fimicolochytrium jonesii]
MTETRGANDGNYRAWSLFIIATVALISAQPVQATPLPLLFRRNEVSSAPVTKYGPAYGSHGAVATESGICSNVGVEILKANGSAVDATIASALCTGVVNAFSSGIGGGGFMIVRTPKGHAEIIDFRETAPASANETLFVPNPKLSQIGGLGVGVPGEIRGFELAHKRYGTLPWARLFDPSIKLARDGFPVTTELAYRLSVSPWILNNTNFAAIYAPKGALLKEGEEFKNPVLAKTLETIAKKGASAYYKGDIAKAIAKAVQQNGGIITTRDLANYSAKLRKPLKGWYQGLEIITPPPPSSGAILLSVLNIVERYNFAKDGLTGLNLHRLIEAFKFGYAQRTELGDPQFVKDIEARVKEFIDKETAANIRANISDTRTFEPGYYRPKYDGEETPGTAHISAIDRHGLAVGLTSTVNLIFGSQVRDNVTGIIFNNEMDDFATPGVPNAFGFPPSPNNLIRPGKRPLSSMVPTIILRDGKLETVVGASGGSRIITATAQAILDTYDFGADVFKTVADPRAHHQLIPNIANLDFDYSKTLAQALRDRGHNVTFSANGARTSNVQIVTLFPNGTYAAASDPRKNGQASAY